MFADVTLDLGVWADFREPGRRCGPLRRDARHNGPQRLKFTGVRGIICTEDAPKWFVGFWGKEFGSFCLCLVLK